MWSNGPLPQVTPNSQAADHRTLTPSLWGLLVFSQPQPERARLTWSIWCAFLGKTRQEYEEGKEWGYKNWTIPDVVSSLTTIKAQGCTWRAESVHYIQKWVISNKYYIHKFQRTKWFTPSLIALLKAKLFLKPITTTTTSLLSNTVPMPRVRAIFGAVSMSLLNKRALARILSYASVLTRVREARDDPVVWN